MEELPNEKLTVEFYPSVDDYVHIASKISGSVPPKTLTTYAYYLFLAINVVVFPAFLFANELVLAGTLVLILNFAAVAFLIPRVNPDSFREYYKEIFGDRERHVARVELSGEGVNYFADDGESFWPWKRITEIEETPDAIYFFFQGNGFAARKSGFVYLEEQKSFLDAARRLHAAGRKELAE